MKSLTTTQPLTILGIDPGTREMGVAIVRGRLLLNVGVHKLRNGERPYDVVGQARKIVMAKIADFQPQVVAIERPLLLPTKRAAVLSVIGQELHARGEELGCRVVEMDAREARKALLGNEHATKFDVAVALARDHFPQLQSKVPVKPARAALGWRPKDRYWLHMFDALALCCAAGQALAADPTLSLRKSDVRGDITLETRAIEA